MARIFSAYAPPLTYGSKVEVASHLGSVSYTISYEPVGSAIVLGRVHYYNNCAGEEKTTESLSSGATITTANVVANVEVDFKGAATGSNVRVTIDP